MDDVLVGASSLWPQAEGWHIPKIMGYQPPLGAIISGMP